MSSNPCYIVSARVATVTYGDPVKKRKKKLNKVTQKRTDDAMPTFAPD